MSVKTEERVIDAFRRWGYLEADLDPLGRLQTIAVPELEGRSAAHREARGYYCGTVGVEFMHILDPERRGWIQERIEGPRADVDREWILERLVRAEQFEEVLQASYLGTKRFSLEGLTSLIPLLDHVLLSAQSSGAVQAVIAMSHRGRLNVMVHIVGRNPVELFTGFEDVDPKSVLGGGDVKYHLGATGEYSCRGGGKIRIHLVSNPSHLEAVSPVALGRCRAKQIRLGEGGESLVIPILLHGDAAFAGQGILAETLNFSGLNGYTSGGAVHIIVNNLIGFTTNPSELHSSRFCADVALRVPVPIFHVNSEDVCSVVRVGRLALEYRQTFASDVVIDLIGYRRHGHSEVDDPTITQPLLYRKIKNYPPQWKIFAERIGFEEGRLQELVREIRSEFEADRDEAKKKEKNPVLRTLPPYWSRYRGGLYDPSYEVETGLSSSQLRKVGTKVLAFPKSFNIHPKVKRLLDQRAEMLEEKRPVDFGMAEALAFGSLLLEGMPVRLSGQDSRRGTFAHRQSVLIDVETEEEYVPLQHLSNEQARFEAYNSMLSEAAVMGFEYGFSRDFPDALVLWEAQFGDFANGAQIIIDQFVSAAEDKWDLLSGLVLLLPHGYEGQGPEHSSARLERYLQLAAEDNIQVCYPSSAAQYFHLLRRQALRSWRKPLVCFTPKSMLRHAAAASPLSDFSRDAFRPVIGEREIENPRRLVLCTGKIGHELKAERSRRQDESTAIVLLEQLYPFPFRELEAELDRNAQARELIWVQEEPANMGALFFVVPRIERVASGRHIRSVKRSASASPATGSAKAHQVEQETLIKLAFDTPVGVS